jgi:anti-sigma-K factor RskA
VFGAPDGALLFQLRRGTKPATVTSVAFNSASDMLCVSSDSETVHVFRLEAKAAKYAHMLHAQRERECVCVCP